MSTDETFSDSTFPQTDIKKKTNATPKAWSHVAFYEDHITMEHVEQAVTVLYFISESLQATVCLISNKVTKSLNSANASRDRNGHSENNKSFYGQLIMVT